MINSPKIVPPGYILFHAVERHQEVIDFCLGYKHQDELKFYSKDECFEDRITLEGNDWTVKILRIIEIVIIILNIYQLIKFIRII